MDVDGAVATLSRSTADRSPGDVVAEVGDMAAATRRMLAGAGIAIQTHDPDRTRSVAAAAGRIGLDHTTLERHIVDLMVGRPPDGDDLRWLAALITTGTLLQRMAGIGVDLARLTLEPDAVAVPPALRGDLVVMTVRLGHLLDDAVRPWRGPCQVISSAPVHLGRQLEEAHSALFGDLAAAARAGLPLAPVLWVDRAIGLLHEAGQLVVVIAETACLAPHLVVP
jgi:hypothetical protein